MYDNILVVDDKEALLNAVSLSLRGEQFNVTTASNGREAYEKILTAQKKASPFKLLIADIQMLGGNGPDLLRALNKAKVQLPTIAISGYGDKDKVVEFVLVGCIEYFDKPFIQGEIISSVKRLLKKNGNEKKRKTNYELADFESEGISVFFEDGCHLITPSGNIGPGLADKLATTLFELFESGYTKYRFDLRYVVDMGEDGVLTLDSFAKIFYERNVIPELKVVNAAKDLVVLFKKANLDEFYRILN